MANMEKKLNISNIQDSMMRLGLSKIELASKLSVARNTVGDWLKPSKFPRPRHLLKLSEILELGFDDLVVQQQAKTPQVAFRKSGNHKIKDEHIERMEYSARLLKKLVPFLPFDQLSSIPKLRDPENNYEYYQKAASSMRNSLGLHDTKIENNQLFKIFGKYNSVLIPVLWGKGHYKNATHIFLPDSETTWTFINMDVNPYDFKFWLCHELGHSKAPQLFDKEGEDFADGFGGAFLFPKHEAQSLYSEVMNKAKPSARFNVIKNCAKDLIISPITIYKQLELFATHQDMESLALEGMFYGANTNFLKASKLLSEELFGVKPTAKQLIELAQTTMESCFFNALKTYLDTSDSPTKFIANLMDISIEDAVALNKELSGATVQDIS